MGCPAWHPSSRRHRRVAHGRGRCRTLWETDSRFISMLRACIGTLLHMRTLRRRRASLPTCLPFSSLFETIFHITFCNSLVFHGRKFSVSMSREEIPSSAEEKQREIKTKEREIVEKLKWWTKSERDVERNLSILVRILPEERRTRICHRLRGSKRFPRYLSHFSRARTRRAYTPYV